MKRMVSQQLLFLGGSLVLALLPCAAQTFPVSASPMVIEARVVPPPPEPLAFASGISPDGHSLAANRRYLVRDGRPWFPIVGEFHYARYSEDGWEQEILKMKAGGIQVISTYVFWIYHEELEGQFDWQGRRDLRRFVELCGKHGLYVWIRVGPWDHGEVRNGGLPDWLLLKGPTRQNDSTYLRYVARFYGAIGGQLKGLFWKDGGPIIGVQLENEYSARGPGKGEEHILRLRQIAREAGLDAPFYTVTGWDGAVVPPHDILPVFGGYADGFWWRSLEERPPNPNFFFTKIRCEENVGEDLTSKHPDIDALDSGYPYLTAEMGGGMASSYHRRPVLTPDDTAAMELVKLGSGVAMYGYYMFHGGTNPDGKKTSLQESQATGYPNDLPLKTYDFQAPLGEFGQANPSFGTLKLFHLFLTDFGADLATMTPYFPEQTPLSRHDTSTPRVAARLRGNHGFIFINNHQRSYPLPDHRNFQVRLNLSSGALNVPEEPITLPAGAYMAWPVNLSLGENLLRYATAQLLCKLPDQNTYVFFAWPGIPAEFVFAQRDGDTIEAPDARVKRTAGAVQVDGVTPGTRVAIRLRNSSEKELEIVVLSREQALDLWKVPVGGKERLLLSAAQLYAEGNKLVLQSSEASQLKVGIFPAPESKFAGMVNARGDGIFHVYEARIQRIAVTAKIEQIQDPGPDPTPKMGKEVVLVPDESAFDLAARWSIIVPDIKSYAVAEILLKITYQGDVARIYTGGNLITDDFYKGTPWIVGLSGISEEALRKGLELRILPLRDHAPIYLPAGARPAIPAGGQVARLQEVQIVPIYRVALEVAP